MSNIFALFTADARLALNQARKLAKQSNESVITSEHLLLGILHQSETLVEQALTHLRLNTDQLKSRLEAYIKLAAKNGSSNKSVEYQHRGTNLSRDALETIEQANYEAEENSLTYVDTRLLVLGMLRLPSGEVTQLLQQYGVTLADFREQARVKDVPPVNPPRFNWSGIKKINYPVFLPSPVFIGLVVVTAITAYLTYAGIGNPGRTIFLSVLFGWIISVALHEFGHALAGYIGGDKSVVDKGYLTLDPLNYTHPVLSIFLPIIFLILGGVPLPGGAVYIDRHAIRNDFMRSLVSASGPLATLLCFFVLIMPFFVESFEPMLYEHFEFWASVATLGFLQLVALFFNLLPLPGLDGFGIMEPFLPPELVERFNIIRPFIFLILLVLIINTPLGDIFIEAMWNTAIDINPMWAYFAYEGFDYFFFWQS